MATQFGCGKTQILNTLTQKDRYIHEWEVMGRNNPSIGARKRFRHSRNEQINRSVHDWYQQQTASGLRVTGPMLQKQARHYATLLEISNFGASNGWLANFRRFYNIISVSLNFLSLAFISMKTGYQINLSDRKFCRLVNLHEVFNTLEGDHT